MFEAELHDAARIAAIVRTHRKKVASALEHPGTLFRGELPKHNGPNEK